MKIILHLARSKDIIVKVFKTHSEASDGIVSVMRRTIDLPEEKHIFLSEEEHEMLKGSSYDEVRLHTPVGCDFLRSVVYPGIKPVY